jgi:hypothetical protein
MKQLGWSLSTLVFVLLGTNGIAKIPALAAEYLGQKLDGQAFNAQVYSYETGGVFRGQVKFQRGKRATIAFLNGSTIPMIVNQKITDLKQIRARSAWSIPGIGLNIGYGSGSMHPRPLQGLWQIALEAEEP